MRLMEKKLPGLDLHLKIALIFLGLVLNGCRSKSPSIPREVSTMTPREAFGELRNDFALLIDLREPGETQKGMAEPALNIPLSRIEKDDAAWAAFTSQMPSGKKIIVYASDLAAAKRVAGRLAAAGFSAAVFGELADWQKEKLPLRKPRAAQED